MRAHKFGLSFVLRRQNLGNAGKNKMAEGDDLLQGSAPHQTVGNYPSHSTSVFFNGGIPEAISTTKSEQKTLIVYIAGDNDDSRRLDEVTWEDAKVRETVSERFVALRLLHGSSDAAHFAAIFPYQQIPSIAILSHNGMILNTQGGYISPSDFLQALLRFVPVQSLIHASEIPESAISLPSNNHSVSEDTKIGASPSCADNIPSSSMDDSHCTTVSEDSENLTRNNELQPLSSSQGQVVQNLSVLEAPNILTQNEVVPLATSTLPKSSVKVNEQKLLNSDKLSASQGELRKEKKQISDSLHLQVRLTNGDSIRQNFKFEDRLLMVKEFVDYSRTDGDVSYSLAVLYPRKLFKEEDMQKTLRELNIEERATLVVVPISSSESENMSSSSAEHTDVNANENTSGSGWIWRTLSYLNPLSYLKGTNANTEDEGSSSSWQYDPDPAFVQGLKAARTESRGLNTGMNDENNNTARNNRTGRSWGGNIHTLKRDEDDENRFKRGNAFWNGNSTEYGGDDSRKL